MENRFLKTLRMFRQSMFLILVTLHLKHQLYRYDIFRLVRVKTFVQRTTTEYDDNGRELEHAGTKEGILI